MVHTNPASIAPPPVHEGVVLRTYYKGIEQAWAEVVNSTDLGGDYDASKVRRFLTERAQFDRHGLFLALDAATGEPLATACAWRGFFAGRVRPALHMVAAKPQARGRGLGKLLCQAVLHHLAGQGEREVVLRTDDHRIPAIATYLSLGFLPMRYHGGEDHGRRWRDVFARLPQRYHPLRFSGPGRPIRVAVYGLRRGAHLAQWLGGHPAGQVVAGCDADQRRRVEFAERFDGPTVVADYAALLEQDADAVIVANDCPEHAPAAVAALRAGRCVLSEVTAFHTLAQGVELVEAVEQTGLSYMMAENCLYTNAAMELAHLACEGRLGALQYAEGDYVHDIRHLMMAGDKVHWRGWMPPLYYCTHPLGPVLRAARVRPRRVVGMHTGCRLDGTAGGIDMGAVLIRATGGGVVRVAAAFAVNREPQSLWLCYYGTRASMETDRWTDAVHLCDPQAKHAAGPVSYRPTGREGRGGPSGGHGGADPRMMQYWIESVANGLASPIDVYESADMTLPGILGHRSSVSGNAPIEVPDLGDPNVRDGLRNDRARPDPNDPRRLIED